MDQDSVYFNQSETTNFHEVFIQIKPFLPKDLYLRICMLTLSYILNFQVILVVSTTRSVRRPRNLFCCFICSMDLLINGLYTTETLAAVTRNEQWCAAFAMFFEIPYSMLLVCLTLASLDRYMAVYHPFFHIRKVTNFRVCCLCFVASVLVFSAILSPYWTGKFRPMCQVNILHMGVVWIVQVILIVLCLVLHVKVLIGARRAIRSWPIHVRFRFHQPHAAGISSTTSSSSEANCNRTRHTSYEPEHTPSRLSTRQSITKLEVRAAITVMLCIAPLWFFTIPLPVMGLAFCLCAWDRGIGHCGTMESITFSAKELYLWHAIYNPIMYILNSREYLFAARRFIFMCRQKICRIYSCNTS